VEGCCEHGYEPSGSINAGKFLSLAAQLAASQERLSSMSDISL
jgi:hypothetical protein